MKHFIFLHSTKMSILFLSFMYQYPKTITFGEVVVAQMAERSLPTPNTWVRIQQFINCLEKTKNKRKRDREGPIYKYHIVS